VVENPDGAAVSRKYEVVVARLNLYVVHGHRGKIVLESRPVGAAVPGNPQAKFRSSEKKVGVPRMLANDVNGSGGIGNALADGFPGFAVVRGRKNVDVVIVAAMCVKCSESRAFSGFRGDDTADVSSLGHPGYLRHHVFPGLATVASDLQVAVIGADPQHIGGER